MSGHEIELDSPALAGRCNAGYDRAPSPGGVIVGFMSPMNAAHRLSPPDV